MDLVNHTPLTADLTTADLPDTENPTGIPAAIPGNMRRFGVLVAKATFTFGADGTASLDTDAPLAIFYQDQETDLGLLPRDDLPREDDVFEVILLGRARPLPGDPPGQARVKLKVGQVSREMLVFGNRIWQGSDSEAQPSEPGPVDGIPLIWDNAFGGQVDIEIDHEAFVSIADSGNSRGKGIEVLQRAREICDLMSSPEGYPRVPEQRPLPNLEDPATPIVAWDDEPRPYCWATVPMDSGVHAERGTEPPEDPGQPLLVTPGIHHRAHPDWVIALPLAGASVVLEGAGPGGQWRFEMPRLRVFADYVVGTARGRDELVPQLLLLLAEERRCILVYKRVFEFPFEQGVERSVRLRTAEGWFGAPLEEGALK